jgi:hypothetical protein
MRPCKAKMITPTVPNLAKMLTDFQTMEVVETGSTAQNNDLETWQLWLPLI